MRSGHQMTPDDSVSPLTVLMGSVCSDNTKSEIAGSEGGWDRDMGLATCEVTLWLLSAGFGSINACFFILFIRPSFVDCDSVTRDV